MQQPPSAATHLSFPPQGNASWLVAIGLAAKERALPGKAERIHDACASVLWSGQTKMVYRRDQKGKRGTTELSEGDGLVNLVFSICFKVSA